MDLQDCTKIEVEIDCSRNLMDGLGSKGDGMSTERANAKINWEKATEAGKERKKGGWVHRNLPSKKSYLRSSYGTWRFKDIWGGIEYLLRQKFSTNIITSTFSSSYELRYCSRHPYQNSPFVQKITRQTCDWICHYLLFLLFWKIRNCLYSTPDAGNCQFWSGYCM